MFQGMLDAVKSKKFWITMAGAAVVTGLHSLGMPQEIIAIVGGLFGVNIASQGAADYAKNKNFIPALKVK